MKAKDFLKLAGVKNEKEFYSKFPTEEAFFNTYPDAIQYKKGGKIKYNPQYREFPPNVMEEGGLLGGDPTKPYHPVTNPDGYGKPIYVTDENDPRLKAYNDSLNVFNKAEKNWMYAQNFGRKNSYGEVYYPTQMVNYIPNVVPIETNLKPLAYHSTVDEDRKFNRDFPVFKKPVQPYKLLERETLTPVSNIEPIGIDNNVNEFKLKQDNLQAPNIPINTNKGQRDFYQAAQQLAYQGQPVGRVHDGDTWTELGAEQWNNLYGTNLELPEMKKKKFEGGGFISPYAEMGLNTDNPSKGKPRVMSAGENVGWTIADIVTSPISSFTGKNLSELASNKVNPYNRKQGSWWGGIEATYVKPAVQGGLADSGIPFVSQVAGMGKGVRENVAPALINEDDDANRLGIQNGMGSMGSSIGGGVSGMMGSFGGSKMMKQGGKLMYNNGGNLMEGMGLNELGGPTHEQGGMAISPQTEVEGGETVMEAENYVFSDSILVPGKKVSFAKESKAIKNKYKLRPNDKLSKESMDNELNALMGSQEKTKAALMQQEEQKFIGKMQKKYGGLISFDRNMQPVEMWDGGTIGEENIDPITGQPFNMNVDYAQPNPALNIKATSLNPEDYIVGNLFNEPVTSNIINPPEVIGTTYNRGLMPENYQYASTPYVKQSDEYTEDFTAGTLPKVKGFESNSEFNPKAVGSGPVDPTNNRNTFDPESIKVPNSAIAALAAGLKGGGKQKLRLTPRMKFNYLNTRPAEILAERQGELGLAAGLNALKDNAGTQGNFIANTVNMAANAGAATGKNVADIRFQGDVQNLGLSNQEAQATQALARENNMLSTQFDTVNLLRKDKTLDDMSRITQSQQVDNEKRKQETMLLEMMSKGIVKWNPKGGGYLIKSVDELTGEETWVPYKTLLG